MRSAQAGARAALTTLILLAAGVAAAQADSAGARVDTLVVPRSAVSPGGAFRRSLIVPGWGQLHVGKPVRAVVAAGVVAGLATGIVLANGRYVRMRHAYLYVSREDANPAIPDSTNEYVQYFDTWQDAGALPASAVRSRRDGARRLRDLSVLGTALGYVLQALDAYVAAHLLDFDVGEDLSIRPVPNGEGVSASLTVRI